MWSPELLLDCHGVDFRYESGAMDNKRWSVWSVGILFFFNDALPIPDCHLPNIIDNEIPKRFVRYSGL